MLCCGVLCFVCGVLRCAVLCCGGHLFERYKFHGIRPSHDDSAKNGEHEANPLESFHALLQDTSGGPLYYPRRIASPDASARETSVARGQALTKEQSDREALRLQSMSVDAIIQVSSCVLLWNENTAACHQYAAAMRLPSSNTLNMLPCRVCNNARIRSSVATTAKSDDKRHSRLFANRVVPWHLPLQRLVFSWGAVVCGMAEQNLFWEVS